MKKKKCEICGERILGSGAYLKTKLVCRKCFNKYKYSKRLPRHIYNCITGVGYQ